MEPLKPATVKDVMDRAAPADVPSVQDDIAEYERLLAERFTRDPDLPMSPQDADDAAQREDRIAQLYKKLFQAQSATPAAGTRKTASP